MKDLFPRVRFMARQAVGGRLILPMVIGTFVFVIIYESSMAATNLDQALARLGLFFIAFAIPNAAVTLSIMENDGRFDQFRLFGVSPGILLRDALAGLAGPWLIVGGALLLVSRFAIPGLPDTAPAVVLLVLASWSISAAGFAVPRVGTLADPRITLVGLSVVIYGLVLTVGAPLNELLTLVPGIAISRRMAYASLFALLLTALVLALPRVVRRFGRPLSSRPRRTRAGVTTTATMFRVLGPVAGRGALLTLKPAIALGLTTATGMALLMTAWRAQPWSGSPLPLVPVFIGAIAVSLTARADADEGRLEILLLSTAQHAAQIAAHVVGLWLPFVAASAILVTAAAFAPGGVPSALGASAATVAVVAPLAVAEGWQRRMLLVYLAPFTFVVMTLLLRIERVDLMSAAHAAWWRTGSYALVLFILGVVWHVAARTLRQPQRRVLQGSLALLAIAVLTAAPLLPRLMVGISMGSVADYAILCLLLLVAGGLLTSPGTRLSVLDLCGPVATCAIVSGGLTALNPRHERIDEVTLALLPACVLWASMRIHERFGIRNAWSIGLRLVMFTAIAQWPGLAFNTIPLTFSFLLPWLRLSPAAFTSGSQIPVASLAFAVAAAAALIYALAIEIGVRFAAATSAPKATS